MWENLTLYCQPLLGWSQIRKPSYVLCEPWVLNRLNFESIFENTGPVFTPGQHYITLSCWKHLVLFKHQVVCPSRTASHHSLFLKTSYFFKSQVCSFHQDSITSRSLVLYLSLKQWWTADLPDFSGAVFFAACQLLGCTAWHDTTADIACSTGSL